MTSRHLRKSSGSIVGETPPLMAAGTGVEPPFLNFCKTLRDGAAAEGFGELIVPGKSFSCTDCLPRDCVEPDMGFARGGGGSPTDTLGLEGLGTGICPLLAPVEYQASVIARVRSSYSNVATRLGEIIIVFDRLRSVFVGS